MDLKTRTPFNNNKKNPPTSIDEGRVQPSNMLEEALLLIEKYFKGKVDDAGKPYINHLIAVSEQMKSEEDKVVALLHDIIENTDISIEELHKVISMNLIGRILVLSHNKEDTYDNYINNILNCGDIHIIKIKMADMWHNMDLSRLNTITNKDIQRFQKYRVYYKKLERKYIQILKNK